MLSGKLPLISLPWPLGKGFYCTVPSTLTTDTIRKRSLLLFTCGIVSHSLCYRNVQGTKDSPINYCARVTSRGCHPHLGQSFTTGVSRILFQTSAVWTRVPNRFGLYAVHRKGEHARTFPILHLCLISASRSGKILLIQRRH